MESGLRPDNESFPSWARVSLVTRILVL